MPSDWIFTEPLFTQDYFPRRGKIPFGDILNKLFFEPIPDENLDFPIHGPNAIRFLAALMDGDLSKEVDLAKDNKVVDDYDLQYPKIMKALEGKEGEKPHERKKVVELLKVAILFHDIGKSIRRANHPPIGANLLRNY